MNQIKPTDTLPPMLLKTAEAARLLAISPRKLWSLTACGAIPCIRVDRSVRYEPSALTIFIQSLKGRAER